MHIPKNCSAWKACLKKGDSEDKQILHNIISDMCVPLDVEQRFFSELSAYDNQASSKTAINNAVSVIRSDPKFFTCSGNTVALRSFQRILRIEPGSRVFGHISEAKKKILFVRFGLPIDTAFDDLPSELTDFIIQEISKDPLTFGNSFRIVWVTDLEEAQPILNSILEVIDRLGLLGFADEQRAAIFFYERSELVASFHVPRVLDGINWSRFRPVSDCSAASGKTLPLTKPEEFGLPEAVHRACEVKVSRIEMRTLI